MDPRHLFADDRHSALCVYCGDPPTTRDHVPSRVFLDQPYPENLPVVAACDRCNNSFSADEEYVACFLDCALAGSAASGSVARERVSRKLVEKPSLATRIAASRTEHPSGTVEWLPEHQRIARIVLKLARGHAAFEFSEPQCTEPSRLWYAPLLALPEDDQYRFLYPDPPVRAIWPEIGSRAFVRATRRFTESGGCEWNIVQPRRYCYHATVEGPTVRMLLGDYLAACVSWE